MLIQNDGKELDQELLRLVSMEGGTFAVSGPERYILNVLVFGAGETPTYQEGTPAEERTYVEEDCPGWERRLLTRKQYL